MGVAQPKEIAFDVGQDDVGKALGERSSGLSFVSDSGSLLGSATPELEEQSASATETESPTATKTKAKKKLFSRFRRRFVPLKTQSLKEEEEDEKEEGKEKKVKEKKVRKGAL